MADELKQTSLAGSRPVGIGGWLILPIIGFFGTIVLTGWGLAQGFAEWAGLKAIYEGANEQLVALRAPVGLSILGGVALILSAALCLYLIFAKHRLIVPMAIAHYAILAVVGLVEVWGDIRVTEIVPGTPRDPSTVKDAVRGVVAAAVWAPYFALSKRVKNTFVEPDTSAFRTGSTASMDLGS